MNLRIRLNLIVTLVLFVVLSVGFYSAARDARENVRAEVASTALLTLKMLDTKIMHFGMDYNANFLTPTSIQAAFRLSDLNDVRHIRVELYSPSGYLLDSNLGQQSQQDQIPTWFVHAMDVVSDQMPPTKRPVFLQGHFIGEVVVTPDPYFEILEIWTETKMMLWLLCLFFAIVNILIYFSVGVALKPIDKIMDGLTDIESGNLATRLPKFSLPDLSQISEKFNVMAEALETSTSKNHHLTQQIILLQEAERKHLARELHDEFGQHLTAIHVDASAIEQANNFEHVKESAVAISSVVKQMMEMLHNMLHRLRPVELEELGLEAALSELLNRWQKRNTSVHCQISCQNDFRQISDTILVAIYRIVQECLTNVSRHADATWVKVQVVNEGSRISVDVIDDGVGFDSNAQVNGFGLAGIKERVEGLDGQFEIKTDQNEGVAIHIKLPLIEEE
jgi:two-component system sensor histidine kinase UhpB